MQYPNREAVDDVLDLAPSFDEPQLTPAGERILDVGSRLFYARGIRAVGVDLIADEAGTTKKTLYDRFGSKGGLIGAYLGRRAARWQRQLLHDLSALPDDAGAAERVVAVFDSLDAWQGANGGRGCAFVNAHAELGGSEHPVREIVRREKVWMRGVFSAIAAAGAVGEGVALQLQLLYEGYLVLGTVAPDDDVREEVRRAAQALLRA